MDSIDNFYRQYLLQGGNADPVSFGVWLIQQAPALAWPAAKAGMVTEKAASPVADDSLAAIYIGRLERFVHFASKKALKQAGIKNTDEFGLMATLFYMGKATKMQLLKQAMMEITTGSQMLKRMKEEGLLLEKENPQDGRSSFMLLSAKGRKLVQNCFQQLAGIEEVMSGLTAEERSQLLHLLDKLDGVHSERHKVQKVMHVLTTSLEK